MTSPSTVAVAVGAQPRASRAPSNSSGVGRWSQTATAVTAPSQVQSYTSQHPAGYGNNTSWLNSSWATASAGATRGVIPSSQSRACLTEVCRATTAANSANAAGGRPARFSTGNGAGGVTGRLPAAEIQPGQDNSAAARAGSQGPARTAAPTI